LRTAVQVYRLQTVAIIASQMQVSARSAFAGLAALETEQRKQAGSEKGYGKGEQRWG
jgi:hypothetical protein